MNKPSNEPINYNAFQDDFEEGSNDINVKLDASKSRFGKKQGPSNEQFMNEVKQYKQKESDIRAKIAETCTRYKAIILDKTLKDNKDPALIAREGDVIKQLANLGLQLDNDQDQPEGIGSIGLCNLLLQINYLQRDMINNLGYEVSRLKKSIAKLESKVNDEGE